MNPVTIDLHQGTIKVEREESNSVVVSYDGPDVMQCDIMGSHAVRFHFQPGQRVKNQMPVTLPPEEPNTLSP